MVILVGGSDVITGFSSARQQVNFCMLPNDQVLNQDGRVVKALDLRSNGHMSAWVRTPLLVDMLCHLMVYTASVF